MKNKVNSEVNESDKRVENFNYSVSYFDGLLTGWNKVSFPIISILVIDALKKYKPEVALDLGCGNGIYYNVLKTQANKIYGIDASEQSVNLCKEKGYYQVKLANATTLPFPDNTFDFLFTSEVIEHVEGYKVMLNEINRVLKPNGILFLTTTCYSSSVFQLPFNGIVSDYLKEIYNYLGGFYNLRKRDAFVRKWSFEVLGGHFHGFIPRRLKDDVKKTGMTILKKMPLYIIPPIQLDPKQITKSAFSRNKNHSLGKRVLMLMVALLVTIFNPFFRFFGIFANNVFILAQKTY